MKFNYVFLFPFLQISNSGLENKFQGLVRHKIANMIEKQSFSAQFPVC